MDAYEMVVGQNMECPGSPVKRRRSRTDTRSYWQETGRSAPVSVVGQQRTPTSYHSHSYPPPRASENKRHSTNSGISLIHFISFIGEKESAT